MVKIGPKVRFLAIMVVVMRTKEVSWPNYFSQLYHHHDGIVEKNNSALNLSLHDFDQFLVAEVIAGLMAGLLNDFLLELDTFYKSWRF